MGGATGTDSFLLADTGLLFLGVTAAVLVFLGAGFFLILGKTSDSDAVTYCFSEVIFLASESSVLLERFFTLNGLGVVVE